MDDLRTRAELLRAKADAIVKLGTDLGAEIAEFAIDLAHQAARPPSPSMTPQEPATARPAVGPNTVDVTAEMLATARDIVAEIRGQGARVSKYAIQDRLRMRGYSVNETRREGIWRRLTGEDPSLLDGQIIRRQPAAREAPGPTPLPTLPDTPAPHASLNGHSA